MSRFCNVKCYCLYCLFVRVSVLNLFAFCTLYCSVCPLEYLIHTTHIQHVRTSGFFTRFQNLVKSRYLQDSRFDFLTSCTHEENNDKNRFDIACYFPTQDIVICQTTVLNKRCPSSSTIILAFQHKKKHAPTYFFFSHNFYFYRHLVYFV